MGLGGILATMVQGLGSGIVKNVEHGWKEDETNKLLNWKAEEADKARKHDFELEDYKTRNAISEATAKARIRAQHDRVGEGGQTQKALTGAIQTLGVYDARLNALYEKAESTEDTAQKDAINKKIAFLSAERENYLKQPEVISAFKVAGQMGRALYATSGGDMDLYIPKPKAPTEDSVVPTITAPKRNIIDVDTISVAQAQQLADQKREEQSRLRFRKASEEAKDWAAKRNQYTQSTFIPRPF